MLRQQLNAIATTEDITGVLLAREELLPDYLEELLIKLELVLPRP
jgi:hypothetical protein